MMSPPVWPMFLPVLESHFLSGPMFVPGEGVSSWEGVFSQRVSFCYWPSDISGLLLIMTEGHLCQKASKSDTLPEVLTSSGSHCSSLKAFLFVHLAVIMFTKHDSMVTINYIYIYFYFNQLVQHLHSYK